MYAIVSLIVFTFMNINEASKLALVEYYGILKNFDFALAVNINTILFLPFVPIYFINGPLKKFLLASVFAVFLLLTFSGWLYVVLAIAVVDQLENFGKVQVYKNLLMQIILVVGMNIMFGQDLKLSLVYISAIYLLLMKRNILIDFIFAVWLINISFTPVEYWILLPFLAITIFKELVLTKSSDYMRAIFWAFLLLGVAKEWIALSFLILLISSKRNELGLTTRVMNTLSIVFITFSLVLLNFPNELKIFICGGLLAYLFAKETEVEYGY